MQMVPVPLYNSDMVVEAYYFRYQMGNDLFSTTQATNIFDGASHSHALESVNLVGLEAFTLGKPLVVPIKYIMLLGGLETQCAVDPSKIIFLFEDAPPPEEPYLSKMQALCEMGFRFAVQNLSQPQKHDAVIRLASFFFLSQRNERKIAAAERIVLLLRKHYRHLTWVATNVQSEEMQKKLDGKGYSLYESRFSKVPVTQGDTSVSPLKANSIRLINMVQNEDFEFEEVSRIVQTDPSLTISLLKMVNVPSYRGRNKVKTISQAVALLGQKEVRKWVTMAVSQSLGNDRPNEITRISLLRAKFAENLAQVYVMAHMSQELFLMGLFSVVDVILQVSMEEALKMLSVSDLIQKALLTHDGLFAPVLDMLTCYEVADWAAVSRHMIVYDLKEDDLSQAYIDALVWYRNMTLPQGETEADDAKTLMA